MKWRKVKINDICNLVRGSSPRPKGDPSLYGGPIPRLMIEDITRDGMYVNATTDSLTELGSTMSRTMKKGDLVLTVSGRTGVPAILATDACIHDGFVGFRELSSDVNPEYLYYYLSFLTEKTNARSVGAIFKNLTTEQVKNIDVPLPPLHIQEQIADTLDKADALRKKDQELLQKYDELAQAIFYDMFGDPEKNPHGWSRFNLREITDCITKGESPNWQGYEYQESGVLFMTSENVGQGKLILEGKIKYIPNAFHEKLRRSQLKEGDVLINLVGASIGRCSVFYNDNQPANINQAVALIRCSKSRLMPDFLSFLLRTDHMQRVIKGGIVESARANISLSDINNFTVILPPLELQTIFLKRIEACKKLISLTSEMPELFEGIKNLSFS